MDLMQREDTWYNIKMLERLNTNFNGRFNEKVIQGGLIAAIDSFGLFVAGKGSKRIELNDAMFAASYSPDEIRGDTIIAKALYVKFHKNEASAEFRPSMLAEQLVKVGESFDLFGNGSKILQSTQFDDYKNHADFFVNVQNDIRDKKDEILLSRNVRFIIDVTTDDVREKAKKISNEFANGKLTDAKYDPETGRALRDVPRFVMSINEEELFEFFKKAKYSLDRANGVNEKYFHEQYNSFAYGACVKILDAVRIQIESLVGLAQNASLPKDVAQQISTYVGSRLGAPYQTLEYIDGLKTSSFGAMTEDRKIMITRYLSMMKKILRVGIAIDRILEEKEKRASFISR